MSNTSNAQAPLLVKSATFHATIERIVAESPDYVYPVADEAGCVYFHNGVPSCLIGQALYAIFGEEFRSRVSPWGNGSPIAALAGMGGPVLEWEDIADLGFAQRIQTLQDRGIAWGECLPPLSTPEP